MRRSKECMRKMIERAFEESKYDLLIVYEVARSLMSCGMSGEEALDNLYKSVIEFSDRLGMYFLPVEYINNFYERLKRTGYYDYWIRRSEEDRSVENVFYLRSKPSKKDLRDLDFVLVRFKDGSIIRLGEYRKLLLEAFEYFKRLKLSDCELIGFFNKIKGYDFEKAVILSSLPLVLKDMLDFTVLDFSFIGDSLRKLGIYDICKRIKDYLGYISVGASLPGFFLKPEFLDREEV